MYLKNEITESVTTRDKDLLVQVCMIIKMLYGVKTIQTKRNDKWSLPDLECHTISRLVRMLIPELVLVDGYVIGIEIKGKGCADVIHICHSWLRTPDNAIIDAYPMGRISTTTALLLPTMGTVHCSHGANFYLEDIGVRNHFDMKKCWRVARSYFRSMCGNVTKEMIDEFCKEIV